MKKFLLCVFIFVVYMLPAFAICDRKLHVADTEIQLCTTKNTTPSLNVRIVDTIYYANTTTEDTPINSLTQRKLKFVYENAIRTIHDNVEYKFFFTPETDENTYSFQMSAAGTFYINWGDDTVDKIVKDNTTQTTYSHTYSDSASNHEIALGGKATGYSSSSAAISYSATGSHLKSMRGSLGRIFSTIEKSGGALSQPRFNGVFKDNYNLTGSIPPELFKGIYGQPRSFMFSNTFVNCKGLTGSIPPGLFGDLYGHPEAYMFHTLFRYCSGLTGSIPENLFGNLSGDLQDYTFYMAFDSCKNLTGESMKMNGKYLYEIWPDATRIQADSCYYGATQLSDYADIPSNWK